MISLRQKNHIIDALYAAHIIELLLSLRTDKRPYRINLSLLSANPQLLWRVACLFETFLVAASPDLIVGPYTDIPLATTISLKYMMPMVFVRKQRKEYGRGRLIEGDFLRGERVVIVDDELKSAASALQLIGRLEGADLKVVGYLTLLPIDSAIHQVLKTKGYNPNAVLNQSDVLLRLHKTGKLNQAHLAQLRTYWLQQRLQGRYSSQS